MRHFDVIVLGVGGMGSAACYSLAKNGLKTLGIERFSIAHDRGASHGHTRLIRKAYFESPHYVPLLQRSYELWSELEQCSGERLFERAGLLMMGELQKTEALPSVLKAAAQFSIPVEEISNANLATRYPQFTPPKNSIGVLEPNAGYLYVEKGVHTFVSEAKKAGAQIIDNCSVVDWKVTGKKAIVQTRNETFMADSLVLTPGPWANECLKDMALPLTICRVVQSWYRSNLTDIPCFAFDEPPHFLYGFPSIPGAGLKAALHAPGEQLSHPDSIDRNIHPSDIEFPSALLASRVARLESSHPMRSTTCFYSLTPDQHFVIDQHPKYSNVVYAAGFSGHGYKFAPVIGEILAELTVSGKSEQPIQFLRYRW